MGAARVIRKWQMRTSIQLTSKDVFIKGRMESEDGVVFFRDDVQRELRKHLAITDAKSHNDALRREARGKEPRVAAAVGEIKQSLVVTSCSFRLSPHCVMMEDPLTKRLHKANLQPRLQVVKSGHKTLGSEFDEEEFQQQQREAGRLWQRLNEGQTSFR